MHAARWQLAERIDAEHELEAVDVDEHGQLSLGVPGEQMPLTGLAPPAPTINQKEG